MPTLPASSLAASPSRFASNAVAFSPQAACFSPLPQLPGFPLAAFGDKTPSGFLGYSSPYACSPHMENFHTSTPTEQAKRLRELQQQWEATAQYFEERSSPAASLGDRVGLGGEAAKAYSPGEVLAKTAETSVAVALDIQSNGSTADIADAVPASPEQGPAYVPEHSDVNPDPKFKLNELPSIGSLGHDTGDCKPCAFFNTKGCGNEKSCKFCHLCDPGEKKRRLKIKKAHYNSVKQMQELMIAF